MFIKLNIPVSISVILLLAFSVRMMGVVLMFLFEIGPQQWTDESSFYNSAVEWLSVLSGTATQTQLDALLFIAQSREFTISYFLSFFMFIYGDSLFLVRLLSVVVGVGSVYLVYRLTYIISNNHSLAKLAALVSALFPPLIVYSIMFTREPYIVLSILLSLWFLLLYLEKNDISYIIAYVGCIVVANYMHGGVAFVMAILGLFYGIANFNKNFLLALMLALIMLSVFFLVDFTYVNYTKDLDTNFIFNEITVRLSGNTLYGTEIDSVKSLLTAIPSLILHFVVGFQWQSGDFNEMFILMNSTLWIFLLVLLFFYLPYIFKLSFKARLVSAAMLLFIIVFSVGSTSYGTALRHKTKFSPLLIILAVSSLTYRDRSSVDIK